MFLMWYLVVKLYSALHFAFPSNLARWKTEKLTEKLALGNFI